MQIKKEEVKWTLKKLKKDFLNMIIFQETLIHIKEISQ